VNGYQSPLTPRQAYWLIFAAFALQGLTTITWNTFPLDPKYVAMAAQVIGYANLLLNFVIHGPLPPPSTGGSNVATTVTRQDPPASS
jgi:hypothetical protein